MSRVGATAAALMVAAMGMMAPGPSRAAPSPAALGSPEQTGDPAVPQEPTVAVSDALSLDPGATCLEHDRLTEQVVTWLEADALDPRLTVVVEGNPIAVNTLRFTLRDRGEVIAERVFAPGPSNCEDLHSVVGLAIALAVDATVLESVGIAVPEPDIEPAPPRPPTEPPPQVVASPASPREPSPGLDLTPRDDPWAWRIRGGAVVTVGAPPPLGGGAELGIELGWRDLLDIQLGILGASAGPQTIDEVTLTITLLAGRMDVCAGPQMGRVRPRFCGGLLAGSAWGDGRGFVQDYQSVVPWVAVAFGGDLRTTLTRRLSLSLDLDGLVTVVRPVFDVREELQVRKLRDLPRFGAAFGVGLVVALGEGRTRARP